MITQEDASTEARHVFRTQTPMRNAIIHKHKRPVSEKDITQQAPKGYRYAKGKHVGSRESKAGSKSKQGEDMQAGAE